MVYGVISYMKSYIPFLNQTSTSSSIVERTQNQKMNIWVPNLLDVRRLIGNFLCRTFYFPLFNDLPSSFMQQMDLEIDFQRTFWDKSIPVDPKHLPRQQDIRDHCVLIETKHEISLPNGKRLIATCPMVKVNSTSSEDPFRIVYFGGNLTMANNTIWFYPWAASIFEIFGTDKALPPVELYLLSGYEIKTPLGDKYTFDDLRTAGFIMAEIVRQIRKNGDIHLTMGQSIGALLLTEMAKHLPVDEISDHICLDRGLTSVPAACEGYYHGWISLHLARFSGWDADSVQVLYKLINQKTIVMVSAVKDRVFKNKANYLNDKRVQEFRKNKQVHLAAFNIPLGISYDYRTHHSYRLDLVASKYLVKEHSSLCMSEDEDLAQVIVHRALQSWKKHVLYKPISKKERKENKTK